MDNNQAVLHTPPTFFDKIIPHLYEPIIGVLLRDLRKKVIDIVLNSDENHLLLDCCAGAGGLLGMYLQHTQKHCIALDKSALMLEKCKKNAPYADIILSDAGRLPFATQSIDVASICMALHTMPQKNAMQSLEELCRVAKNVIIADYCLADRNLALPAATLAHAIEALIGGEHYACYKAFQKQGGLDGLLYHMGISPTLRQGALGGAGSVVVLTPLTRYNIC